MHLSALYCSLQFPLTTVLWSIYSLKYPLIMLSIMLAYFDAGLLNTMLYIISPFISANPNCHAFFVICFII